MRSKNWLNAARLLESWFSRQAATAPTYGPPDTMTIRMDSWVLTFPRARRVYDRLMQERIWANPAAQQEIARMLRRKGLVGPGGLSFGFLQQSVPSLDADYINFRTVGFGLFDLDDMTAALGNFTFRVAVGGTVAPLQGQAGHEVQIHQVGVYVRDSFDFNGDQFLGFWDDADDSVSMVNPFSGTAVHNSDFRDWRAQNGRGGDFLVFSDVKMTSLSNPDTFTI
jgi:hypothetical protein